MPVADGGLGVGDAEVSHSGGAAGLQQRIGRLFTRHGPFRSQSSANPARPPLQAVGTRGQVADQFLTAAGTPPSPTPPASGIIVSAAEVSGKGGVFFSEPGGDPMRLTAVGNRLSILGGGALVAVATGRFRIARPTLSVRSQDDFELHFFSDDLFELRSMEGKLTRYRRAVPYVPTSMELYALAGRYQSDEVGSVFQVVPAKNGLVMRFELAPEKALPLAPVERDAFQVSQVTVRFLRDRAGKVTGFDYTNPLIRNLRYARISDQ